MFKVSKKNIASVVKKITCNSELFGDEEGNVFVELNELLKDAEKFGTAIYGNVPNWWGQDVAVVAIPERKCHEWHF